MKRQSLAFSSPGHSSLQCVPASDNRPTRRWFQLGLRPWRSRSPVVPSAVRCVNENAPDDKVPGPGVVSPSQPVSPFPNQPPNFFQRKKEWFKFNGVYIVSTAAARTAAFASSYLAEKLGLERAYATTMVSTLFMFGVGLSTFCFTWYRAHKQEYADRPGQLAKDLVQLVVTLTLAEFVASGVSWNLALFDVFQKSNFLATLVNQASEWLLFLPLINVLNRGLIKRMKENGKKETRPAEVQTPG